MVIELEESTVPDATALRRWLEGDPANGVWLTLAKKGIAGPTKLTYAEAVDEALCFGWIDGQGRNNDAATYFVRFTPRRARSPWSRRNVDLVARLVQEGRMHQRGLAEVERAKADGRWQRAYAGPKDIGVPPELTAALERNPEAAAMFAILSSTNRYAILYRLHEAKREDTRSRRLEQFVAMLTRGETVYPQKARLD